MNKYAHSVRKGVGEERWGFPVSENRAEEVRNRGFLRSSAFEAERHGMGVKDIKAAVKKVVRRRKYI